MSDDYNPLDDDIDSYQIPDISTPAVDIEQRIYENSGSFPLGEQELVVQGFVFADEQKMVTVSFLDGRPRQNYYSQPVWVVFALASEPDSKTTVRDYFLFPPAEKSEWPAYEDGCSTDAAGKIKPKSKGFWANKFYIFMKKLGFPFEAGGKLPPESRDLRNWKRGRTILATIEMGEEYKGRCRPQIVMHSYKLTEATAALAGMTLPPEPAPTGNKSKPNGQAKREPALVSASGINIDDL